MSQKTDEGIINLSQHMPILDWFDYKWNKII